jgi:c-di-GMP-binding flagellar brake protein YcgR
LVSALSGDGYIELPRGLTVRLFLRDDRDSLEAVVRRVDANSLTLGLLDLPEPAEALRGQPASIAAQLHGRAYRFEVEVLGFDRTPPALLVTMPVEARRAERRQFYRLNHTIEMKGTWRERPLGNEEGTLHSLEGRLLDIGGGGALLRTRTAVPVGTLMTLEFSLDGDETPVRVNGRAIHVQEEKRTHAYRINTEFEGISRRIQEQIIRFIFRQQTMLSRRRSQ